MPLVEAGECDSAIILSAGWSKLEGYPFQI